MMPSRRDIDLGGERAQAVALLIKTIASTPGCRVIPGLAAQSGHPVGPGQHRPPPSSRHRPGFPLRGTRHARDASQVLSSLVVSVHARAGTPVGPGLRRDDVLLREQARQRQSWPHAQAPPFPPSPHYRHPATTVIAHRRHPLPPSSRRRPGPMLRGIWHARDARQALSSFAGSARTRAGNLVGPGQRRDDGF